MAYVIFFLGGGRGGGGGVLGLAASKRIIVIRVKPNLKGVLKATVPMTTNDTSLIWRHSGFQV